MSIITISRGTFGGGKAVAEALAEHLGYLCISRETIAQDAAETFGVPEKNLHDAILKTPGFFNKQVSNSVINLKYLRASLLNQCKVFKTVYHGWGGHLLLKGVPRLLRVRITAGMEYRIKSAMDNEQIDRERAILLIIEMDKQRSQWARTLWGIEWSDQSLYDLVLNLDGLSIDSAVKIIARTMDLDEFKEDGQTHQAFNDQHIVSKIWVALIRNSPTRGVRVEITSSNGHVIITGDVGSMKIVTAIVAIAEEIEGVKSVTNSLDIGASWMW
jgi:cytidylate kinase